MTIAEPSLFASRSQTVRTVVRRCEQGEWRGGRSNPEDAALCVGFQEGTADYTWVLRRITPTPLNAYLTAPDLHAPFGNGVPKTYIRCTKLENPVIDGSRALVRSQSNGNWIDFPGPHDPMITDPDGIVRLLQQV